MGQATHDYELDNDQEEQIQNRIKELTTPIDEKYRRHTWWGNWLRAKNIPP